MQSLWPELGVTIPFPWEWGGELSPGQAWGCLHSLLDYSTGQQADSLIQTHFPGEETEAGIDPQPPHSGNSPGSPLPVTGPPIPLFCAGWGGWGSLVYPQQTEASRVWESRPAWSDVLEEFEQLLGGLQPGKAQRPSISARRPCLASSVPAAAGERPKVLHKGSCRAVRVTTYHSRQSN